MHCIRLDLVDDADLVTFGNEEFNRFITVVSRGFKTNDEAGAFVRIENRGQSEEVIIVVGEFGRPDEYFTFGRDGEGKVVEFGNVDANIVKRSFGFSILWHPPAIIIVDLPEISAQKYSGAELRHIQLINNSDKGSGKTLHKVVRATGKNQKSHSI